MIQGGYTHRPLPSETTEILRIPFWRNISHRSFFVEEPPASFFQLQCWCRHLEKFWSCGPLRNLLIWTFKLYLVAGTDHDLLVSWVITTVNPFKVVETCPRNQCATNFNFLRIITISSTYQVTSRFWLMFGWKLGQVGLKSGNFELIFFYVWQVWFQKICFMDISWVLVRIRPKKAKWSKEIQRILRNLEANPFYQQYCSLLVEGIGHCPKKLFGPVGCILRRHRWNPIGEILSSFRGIVTCDPARNRRYFRGGHACSKW